MEEPIRSAPRIVETTPPVDAEVKNVVQWGPILAGIATTVAVMIVLSVLGLAIGTSAFKPRDSGQSIGTAASIWGGASAIVAFFLGGLVAAHSASVPGKGSGLLNGFIVGAAMLVLVLYLTGTGLGNLFGTVGSNIRDISDVVQRQTGQQGLSATDIQNAKTSADQAFHTVKDAAWGTLAGLVLALVAAAVGGLVGSNSRRDVRERAPDLR